MKEWQHTCPNCDSEDVEAIEDLGSNDPQIYGETLWKCKECGYRFKTYAIIMIEEDA